MANFATLTCLMLAILASTASAPSPGRRMLADTWQRWGALTPPETFRLFAIQDHIGQTGGVTDQDVDYAIRVIKTPPQNPKYTVFRRGQAVASLVSECKHWTTKQKNQMFQAAVWLLSQPEPQGQEDGSDPLVSDKFPFMGLLNAVHEKRCLPYLQKLEKDPNPKVASEATKTYEKIAGDKK